MFSLTQRLILGALLPLALLAGVAIYVSAALSHAASASGATHTAVHSLTSLTIVAMLLSFAIAAALLFSVLRPLRRTAAEAQELAQGRIGHLAAWSGSDDLGAIAAALNRMAAQLREFGETASGRRELEHQLSHAVVQSIFEPVIVTDARGEVLKLNQTAAKLLGDAAGDRMALTNTPGGEKILSAVREAVSMQRAIAGEGEAAMLPMRIGEAQRSFRLRTTPMRDENGKLLGAVSVLEDVTELQELDHFKTRFIAIASEKLRKPLESLRLSLYSLLRGFAGDLRPLQLELVEGAQEEAERLNDLMSDLIDVAELDVGKREIRIERLRPIDVLEDARARFREEARARDIEIQVRAYSDLSPIKGDRRALRSVMENLLSNALRYTPPRGTIFLEAEEREQRVQFFVRDTGRGIEPQRLPRLFGRFTADQAGSTGLGLALVHRLIDLQHGQVSVESRLGQGTTFSFTLPIASAVPSRHSIEIG